MTDAAQALRVIVATRIYAPEPAAAAFRLNAMVNELSDSGADVLVLTASPPKRFGSSREKELNVRRWPVLRDKQGYVKGYASYASFDIPLFFRLLCTRRPDVIIVEPPPSTGAIVRLIAACRRVPYVYYAADIWSEAAESTPIPRWVVKALRHIEAWAMRGAAHVIAVSDGVAEHAYRLGAHKVTVVRNGIDTTVFTSKGRKVPATPVAPYALYAGTLSQWQGPEIWVTSMARVLKDVPSAQLVMLGRGSSYDHLKKLAAELPDGGKCVNILPSVPQSEAADWFRGAAVALASVRPGVGYDFALPTKIFAAAACGVPVLFTGPRGPAWDLVEEGQIGTVCEFDELNVSRELVNMLTASARPDRSSEISDWAEKNVSVRKSSAAVASVIRSVVHSSKIRKSRRNSYS